MDFRLLSGEWNHPGYGAPISGVKVINGTLVFRLDRVTGGPGMGLIVVASILIGVAIFVLFWVLFKAVVFLFFFIPPLAIELLRPFAGGPRLVSEEVTFPVQRIRNVGGGGGLVAFGIDPEDGSPEISVLLRMADAMEAERLRVELQRG